MGKGKARHVQCNAMQDAGAHARARVGILCLHGHHVLSRVLHVLACAHPVHHMHHVLACACMCLHVLNLQGMQMQGMQTQGNTDPELPTGRLHLLHLVLQGVAHELGIGLLLQVLHELPLNWATGNARQSKGRPGQARQGKAKQGKARQGKVGQRFGCTVRSGLGPCIRACTSPPGAGKACEGQSCHAALSARPAPTPS